MEILFQWTQCFSVQVVYSFQNEPGKSKLSDPGISFSVERSEKDKYTDLCERELV